MAIRHVLPVCCVYKISINLHQPIRLRKMHNTELLIEAMSRLEVWSCADWMRSRANGARGLTAFALSMLSKCSLANIFYYYYKKIFQRANKYNCKFCFSLMSGLQFYTKIQHVMYSHLETWTWDILATLFLEIRWFFSRIFAKFYDKYEKFSEIILWIYEIFLRYFTK